MNSFEIFDDPDLKTSIKNYEFKYVPTVQFQRVIKTVQKDRFNEHKKQLWNQKINEGGTSPRYSINKKNFRSRSSSYKVLNESKFKNINYVPNTSKSVRLSRVPTMSDFEIDNVIQNAIQEVIPGNTEHIKFDIPFDPDESNEIEETENTEAIEQEDKTNLNEIILNENLHFTSANEDNDEVNVNEENPNIDKFHADFDENKVDDLNTDEIILESINLADIINSSRSKINSGRLSSKSNTRRSSRPETPRTPRSKRKNIILESNLVIDSPSLVKIESLNNNFVNEKYLNDSENDENDNNLIVKKTKSTDLNVSDVESNVEKKISTQIENIVTDEDDDLNTYSSCDEKQLNHNYNNTDNNNNNNDNTEIKSEIEESDAESCNPDNSNQNYLEKMLNLKAFNKNLEQISNDDTTDMSNDECSDRKMSDLDKPPFPRIEIHSRNNENEIPLTTAPINLLDLYSKAKFGINNYSARSNSSGWSNKFDRNKKKQSFEKIEKNASATSDDNIKSDDENNNDLENEELKEQKSCNDNKVTLFKKDNEEEKDNFKHKKKCEKNNTVKINEVENSLSPRSISPIKSPCAKKSLNENENSSTVHLTYDNTGAIQKKTQRNIAAYNPLGSSNFTQKTPSPQKIVKVPSKHNLETLFKCSDSKPKTPKGVCLTEDAKVADSESATNIMLMFSKVTAYQEKINFLLEKLRHEVLSTSPPESNFEKRRREKNVIEFSARFARNYLYQLERLIEDIRTCQLNIKGNDRAYIKVCGLYGLFYQALQSYLKQLKYFLMDKKPRKLDILLRLVLKGTEVCVLRHFFDKDDMIITVMDNLCHEILDLCFEPEQIQQKPAPVEHVEKKIPRTSRLDTCRQQNKLSMYDSSKPMLTERKKYRPLGTSSSKLSMRRTSNTKVESVESRTQNALERRLQTFLDCGQNEKLAQKLREREEREKRRHSRREYSPSEFKIETVDTFVENCENIESAVDIPCSSGETAKPSKKAVAKPSNKTKSIQKTNEENQPSLSDFIDQLQTITKKEIQQILSPLITHLGALLTEASPLNINEILNKFNAQVLNLTESTMSTNLNSKQSFTLSETLKATEEITENILVAEPSIILRELNMPDDVMIPNSQKDIRDMNCGDTWKNNNNNIRNNNEINTQEKKSHLQVSEEITIKTDQDEFKDVVQENFITNTGDDVICEQYLYDRNIQYTFINNVQNDIDPIQFKEKNYSNTKLNENFRAFNKNGNINIEEDIFSDVNEEPDDGPQQKDYIQNLNGMFLNRIDFIEEISDNPLYVNENFTEPWKIVSKISSDILTELLADVETGINFDEENYINQFLDTELTY